jgi:hypothetical protein
MSILSSPSSFEQEADALGVGNGAGKGLREGLVGREFEDARLLELVGREGAWNRSIDAAIASSMRCTLNSWPGWW